MTNIEDKKRLLLESLERESTSMTPHHTVFLVPGSDESNDYWMETGRRVAAKTESLLTTDGALCYPVIFPGLSEKRDTDELRDPRKTLFDKHGKLIKPQISIDEERPFTVGFKEHYGIKSVADIVKSPRLKGLDLLMEQTVLRTATDYNRLEVLSLRSGYYLPGVRLEIQVL